MTKNQVETKTAQQIAEERVAAEETALREERVAELAREEEDRRGAEARERKREEARQHAAEEARKLAGKRLELEQAAEEQAAALVETLQALVALDADHRRAIGASGGSVPTMPVVGLVAGWLSSVFKPLGMHLGGDAFDGASLSDRDTLTPAQPGSPRYASPEELEEAVRMAAKKRAERDDLVRAGKARAMLESLRKTHTRLRDEYRKPISFDLVASRTGGWKNNVLTPEEIEEFKASIEERA